ncbi:MAG: anti-sigma factor [Aeromicrobium sp.]
MSSDLHSLMAPYALDALDREERERFEAHLDQCADCQAELAGFMATAVRLGDAVRHTPPPALRDRLLAEIRTTPQERPVVTALAQRRGVRRTLPRLAMAAAFLVGTVGVGGYVVEHRNAEEVRSYDAAVERVMSSPDAQTVEKSFDAGGNVRMVMSPTADAAVIFANDLPDPGRGKVYQVWMIGADGPASQGWFKKSDSMVMDGIKDADRVAVTVEPDGGSKQPTSAPIATIGI